LYLKEQGVSFNTDTQRGKYVLANYQGDVVFEKGNGTVSIRLIKINNEWRILNFKINSNNLIP